MFSNRDTRSPAYSGESPPRMNQRNGNGSGHHTQTPNTREEYIDPDTEHQEENFSENGNSYLNTESKTLTPDMRMSRPVSPSFSVSSQSGKDMTEEKPEDLSMVTPRKLSNSSQPNDMTSQALHETSSSPHKRTSLSPHELI